MLFLVKYHRRAGYVDGEIKLGLIEAENEEAAFLAAKKVISWKEVSDGEITVAKVGTMLNLLEIPTKYRD